MTISLNYLRLNKIKNHLSVQNLSQFELDYLHYWRKDLIDGIDLKYFQAYIGAFSSQCTIKALYKSHPHYFTALFLFSLWQKKSLHSLIILIHHICPFPKIKYFLKRGRSATVVTILKDRGKSFQRL